MLVAFAEQRNAAACAAHAAIAAAAHAERVADAAMLVAFAEEAAVAAAKATAAAAAAVRSARAAVLCCLEHCIRHLIRRPGQEAAEKDEADVARQAHSLLAGREFVFSMSSSGDEQDEEDSGEKATDSDGDGGDDEEKREEAGEESDGECFFDAEERDPSLPPPSADAVEFLGVLPPGKTLHDIDEELRACGGDKEMAMVAVERWWVESEQGLAEPQFVVVLPRSKQQGDARQKPKQNSKQR